MSIFSKALGLDHPSNKPLLDVLNGVGRAFAQKAGLENADPGKLLLNLLLQKYAPQHLDPVMSAIEGVAVSQLGDAVSKVEGLPTGEAPAPPAEVTQSQVEIDAAKLQDEEKAFQAEAQTYEAAHPEPAATPSSAPDPQAGEPAQPQDVQPFVDSENNPSVSQGPSPRQPLFTR